MSVAVEYTFSMLKPDATSRNITGLVNAYLEEGDLEIAAQKMVILTKEQAEQFYAEHKTKAFFPDLIKNITAGSVILQVLKGEDAIKKNREIMGATNPEEAEEGTIRGDLSESIDFNTIHGSDSAASAEREINFFFKKDEILR
jgi:nucleoside-diphosphate kinase